MAVYRPHLTAEDINAVVTAITVNKHVAADTVNKHVSGERVNELVAADTVNNYVSGERVNSLITAERVNDLIDMSGLPDAVAGIIANIGVGDVGSYAVAWLKTDHQTAAPGVVKNGSELRFASTYSADNPNGHGGSNSSMDGKWRAMGYCGGVDESVSDARHTRTTLWLRVE